MGWTQSWRRPELFRFKRILAVELLVITTLQTRPGREWNLKQVRKNSSRIWRNKTRSQTRTVHRQHTGLAEETCRRTFSSPAPDARRFANQRGTPQGRKDRQAVSRPGRISVSNLETIQESMSRSHYLFARMELHWGACKIVRRALMIRDSIAPV